MLFAIEQMILQHDVVRAMGKETGDQDSRQDPESLQASEPAPQSAPEPRPGNDRYPGRWPCHLPAGSKHQD